MDENKCTLCGECIEACPVTVKSEIGGGIEERKAVYMPYAQAFPRTYVIDGSACTKCGNCVQACAPGAINLEATEMPGKLNAGAIMLGFGFEPFRAELKGEYGLERYSNVVSTSAFGRIW